MAQAGVRSDRQMEVAEREEPKGQENEAIDRQQGVHKAARASGDVYRADEANCSHHVIILVE